MQAVVETRHFIDCDRHGRIEAVNLIVSNQPMGLEGLQLSAFHLMAQCPKCLELPKPARTVLHVVSDRHSPCGRRCHDASGIVCSCSCGGKNHGINALR